MDSIMSDISVKDFTSNGKCSNCGNCCTDFLPMSIHDLKKIKRYVKKHHIKECHADAYYLSVGDTLDATCPFRNNIDHICNIYPVRPEICRLFICSDPMDKLLKQRNGLYKKYKQIHLRGEIYGSSQMDLLNKIMNGKDK